MLPKLHAMKQISFFTLSLFLIFIPFIQTYAQTSPKGIVSRQNFIQSGTYAKEFKIGITDLKNQKNTDPITVNWLLTKEIGPLFNNHLAWDIIDTTIYLIRTYEDNFGQNFAQLKSYNINEIKRLFSLNKDSLRNYIISPDNTKASPDPLGLYAFNITFKNDTLTGKVYFDLYCNTKSLNLYIYLEDNKRLEIWEFTHYPIRQGFVNNKDKEKLDEIYKRKPWEKIFSQSINIACPFSVFNANQKDVLIDANGQIYQLKHAKIEKMRSSSIPNIANTILIINKNTNELSFIPAPKFFEKNKLSTEDKIRKFSQKIRLDD